jgi:OTU domain-containing protein 6
LREEDELQYRHRNELEEMEETEEDENGGEEMAKQVTFKDVKKQPAAEIEPKSQEDETINNKKNKAAKKREKERQKVKERDERIAAEKAGAGPTPRDIELAVIAEKLKNGNTSSTPEYPPLRVHEILSDGHCLYRSVAHQIQLRSGDDKVRMTPSSVF